MEGVLAIIIVVVLCKILGVSNLALIMGGVFFIELVIIAMAGAFVFFTLNILLTKRKKAVFSRIDNNGRNKFKVAFYRIGDDEFPCIFPKESAFTGMMYRSDRQCTVLYSRLMKKVYDKWAVMTCVVGTIFSIAAVVFTLTIIREILL